MKLNWVKTLTGLVTSCIQNEISHTATLYPKRVCKRRLHHKRLYQKMQNINSFVSSETGTYRWARVNRVCTTWLFETTLVGVSFSEGFVLKKFRNLETGECSWPQVEVKREGDS